MYNLVAHKIIMFVIFRDVKTREEKSSEIYGEFVFLFFEFEEEKARSIRKQNVLRFSYSYSHLSAIPRQAISTKKNPTAWDTVSNQKTRQIGKWKWATVRYAVYCQRAQALVVSLKFHEKWICHLLVRQFKGVPFWAAQVVTETWRTCPKHFLESGQPLWDPHKYLSLQVPTVY